jgi:hypothetical protein
MRLVAPIGQALAVAEVAVAGDVLGQDGLAAGEYLVADVLGDAGILVQARVAVAVHRHLEVDAAARLGRVDVALARPGRRHRQHRAHVGRDRLQERVQDDLAQVLVGGGRAHVERQPVEQR